MGNSMPNDYAKIVIVSMAILSAFLVFSMNTLPLNAQAESTFATLTMPSQVAPGSPLYKYVNHVNVTQSEWATSAGDPLNLRFSSSATAPTTNHLLWKDTLCRMYEALLQGEVVFNGVVIVGTDTGKSIYPGVTFAVDQNNGQIIWSLPSSVSFSKLSSNESAPMWSGSTAYSPYTGQVLYTLTTRPTTYDPVLGMAWATGPIGYSWPNVAKNPVQVWNDNLGASIAAYDNSTQELFSVTGNNFTCYNAKTGAIVWNKQVSTALTGTLSISKAINGRLVVSSSYEGVGAVDEATGKLLWFDPSMEIDVRAVGYGLVICSSTRTYYYAFDINDGHMVWKYAPMRNVPYPQGGPSSYDGNETMKHSGFYTCAIADGYVYCTTMQETTYPTLLPPNYPGIQWPPGSGVYYWVNPNPFPVIAHPGENEFVCLNVYTGAVVWRAGVGYPLGPNVGTAQDPAYAGPNMGYPAIADGMVFGTEEPYSSHTGVGTSRPELDPLGRYPESIPKWYISNQWYPGNLYCFGPGPVQLAVGTSLAAVGAGQSVTISGSAVDMSPAASLPGASKAAVGLPVLLRFIGPSSGAIANVVTNSQGQFTATWTPSTTGTYSIVASSAGSASYQAAAPASTILTVTGTSPTIIGSIMGIAAITVSVGVITMPIGKRKQEEGEELLE